MTREQLFQRWRNLSFWQYLILESSFCIIIALIVKFVLPHLVSDYAAAIADGLFYGGFFAIIDYAFRKTRRKKPL